MKEYIKQRSKEMKEMPDLEDEEVIELIKKIEEGDEKAKNTLIKSCVRMVFNIAKKYKNHCKSIVEFEELEKKGKEGLEKAIDTYNMVKGATFSTYAKECITEFIESKLNKNEVNYKAIFYAEIGKLPELQEEDVWNFSEKIRAGRNAKERLVKLYYKLVAKYIQKYTDRYRTVRDVKVLEQKLVQEIKKAIDTYEIEDKKSFDEYVEDCMKNFIVGNMLEKPMIKSFDQNIEELEGKLENVSEPEEETIQKLLENTELDKKTKKILIKESQGIMLKVVKKYVDYCEDKVKVKELIQAGMKGLEKAIDTYVPEVLTSFTKYVEILIKDSMENAIERGLIKVPKKDFINEIKGYENKIADIPVIEEDEIKELERKIREGKEYSKEYSKNKLIAVKLMLVIQIIRKYIEYCENDLEFDELLKIGGNKLKEVVEKYQAYEINEIDKEATKLIEKEIEKALLEKVKKYLSEQIQEFTPKTREDQYYKRILFIVKKYETDCKSIAELNNLINCGKYTLNRAIKMYKQEKEIRYTTYIELICENHIRSILNENIVSYIETNYSGIQVETIEKEVRIQELKKVKEAYKAKKQFIEGNLKLVLSEAMKYRGCCGTILEYEDIVQHGNIGLIKAVDTYDYIKGTKFSSYAVPVIKASIKDALKELNERAKHISDEDNEGICKIIQYQKKYEEEKGKKPSIEEISENTKISIGKVNELMVIIEYQKVEYSLNAPIGKEMEGTLMDIVSNKAYEPEVERVDEVDKEYINDLLKRLRPKEKKYLELKYGFIKEKKNIRDAEIMKELGFDSKEEFKEFHERTLRRFKMELKRKEALES